MTKTDDDLRHQLEAGAGGMRAIIERMGADLDRVLRGRRG